MEKKIVNTQYIELGKVLGIPEAQDTYLSAYLKHMDWDLSQLVESLVLCRETWLARAEEAATFVFIDKVLEFKKLDNEASKLFDEIKSAMENGADYAQIAQLSDSFNKAVKKAAELKFLLKSLAADYPQLNKYYLI